VSGGPAQRASRREELIARCQRERYELVGATATARALLPRARRMAHWIRAISRMLRVISASMRTR
jgi:hypothetical protein